MKQSRLPNQGYRMLVNLDENGKQCWATEVRELLCKTGFYFVWLQQGIGDVISFCYIFKQGLLDMFTQEWTADIRDKEKYEMYRSFKVMFGAEKVFINYRYILFQSSTDETPTWHTSSK